LHQISEMKGLLTISFSFLCLVVFAQKPSTTVKKDTVKKVLVLDTSTAPILTFANTVVSYGSIEQGSNPIRTVKFTNTGKTPLIISHCASPCVCLVASATTQVIAPGATGEIELKYNTELVGTFNKTVTVYSNAKKTVVLSVKGIVRPKAATKKTSVKK